jgi:hypothetical protein
MNGRVAVTVKKACPGNAHANVDAPDNNDADALCRKGTPVVRYRTDRRELAQVRLLAQRQERPGQDKLAEEERSKQTRPTGARRGKSFSTFRREPMSNNSEGTPGFIMEAGAAGLPVVSTRHGCVPEKG